jgi:hypothetical protein
MGRETMYRQCLLSKPVDGGQAFMVSWVRQAVTIPGARLRGLEDPDTGRIEEGWQVVDATDPPMPEHVLLRQSRDWKRTRSASDI